MKFINMYAPNIGAPKYIKEMLTDIKVEIESSMIILGGINAQLSSMDRQYSQKINKETLAINDTLTQINLTETCRIFQPNATEYTFFSGIYGTFFRIDHMLDHKMSH